MALELNYVNEEHERCQNKSCNGHKLVQVQVCAKVSDGCSIQWYPHPKTGDVKVQTGYVPNVLGLGTDSDCIEIKLCIECGVVQNSKGR